MAGPLLAIVESGGVDTRRAIVDKAHDSGQETINTAVLEEALVEDVEGYTEGEAKTDGAFDVEAIEAVTPEHAGIQKQEESPTLEAAEAVTSQNPGGSPKAKADVADDNMNVVSTSDKEEALGSSSVDSFKTCTSQAGSCSLEKSVDAVVDHPPASLPRFREPKTCMWTASHAANAPSEDRSSSLINVLLRPLGDESSCCEYSLVRMSLWAVVDGHGGGSVATYASKVLLPHIAANVSRTLNCEIVDPGEYRVNDKVRDANDIDFEGLVRSSQTSQSNPHSIHYRTPNEEDDIDSDDDVDINELHALEKAANRSEDSGKEMEDCDSRSVESGVSHSSSLHSVSLAPRRCPTGMHSTDEVAQVTEALTDSFCAVDEGWINSIDVNTTYQTSCQQNGAWNAGACALVALTLQRLEWTGRPETEQNAPKTAGEQDTVNQHKDAARFRMTEVPNKGTISLSVPSSMKSLASSLSDPASVFDSAVTETEDDEDMDESQHVNRRRDDMKLPENELLSGDEMPNCAPGSCECHGYRHHQAMLYTAHVGDCRAVLLGTAPPRIVNVPSSSCPRDDTGTAIENSSLCNSVQDELLSSSDHDTCSSDEALGYEENSIAPPHMKYMSRPARRMRVKRNSYPHNPFVSLPSLSNKGMGSSWEETESSDDEQPPRKAPRKDLDHVTDSNDTLVNDHYNASPLPPPFYISPLVRPIDLTNDHSAYNPSEVTAVRRRCKNHPKAISSASGGGIRRVAGSLAVTRALGDAYLKTPRLSFSPFKWHAPYITARPEVNYRLLPQVKDPMTNNVIVLATDGVWEHADGNDILRWMKCFSEERTAFLERKSIRVGKGTEEPFDADPSALSRASAPNGKAVCADKKRTIVGSQQLVGASKKRGRTTSTAADVIVKRVLNRVRRSRKMSSLRDLVALPPGRARRSVHDDITSMVVDLGAFIAC